MVLEVWLISQEEVQFWKTMGFHFVECDYPFGRNLVGQRVLSKRLDPLPSGRKVNVEIRSFDEDKFWRQEDLPPETTRSTLGVEYRYGPIMQLAERLTIPCLVGKRSDRPAVEIFVDNRRVYFDMANGPGGERV